MLVEKLKVGKKGEIYISKRIRELLGLKPDSYVVASVREDKLIIQKIPDLKELLSNYYAEVSWEDVEKLSMKMQERLMEHEE